jgi:hypothetical protein
MIVAFDAPNISPSPMTARAELPQAQGRKAPVFQTFGNFDHFAIDITCIYVNNSYYYNIVDVVCGSLGRILVCRAGLPD